MDARKEDAKCLGKPEGLAGLFVWLKKVGLPIHLPGLPGAKKISPPLALMTPEALTEGEAKQVMAEIKAAMEKQLGQPVTLIDLGLVDVSSGSRTNAKNLLTELKLRKEPNHAFEGQRNHLGQPATLRGLAHDIGNDPHGTGAGDAAAAAVDRIRSAARHSDRGRPRVPAGVYRHHAETPRRSGQASGRLRAARSCEGLQA